MPVVEGRVQEVDSRTNGRGHSGGVSLVSRVIHLAQVRPEPDRGNVQMLCFTIELAVTLRGKPLSERRGRLGGGIAGEHRLQCNGRMVPGAYKVPLKCAQTRAL